MPVADGGEGTMETLLLALGGESRGAQVGGPLGDPVRAGFALLEHGGAAVVEVAQASGLTLVPPERRDAERASSAGTGELIAAAIEAGAEVVLVAAGGSATTDGGAGAIEALDERGGLRGAALVVLCDVRTPWEQAASVFAPQKGADARSGQAPSKAARAHGADAAARSARRADERRGRRPGGRAVGALRRRAAGPARAS